MDEFVHISLERWTKICLELKELERLKGSSDNEEVYRKGLERGLTLGATYLDQNFAGSLNSYPEFIRQLSRAGYTASASINPSVNRYIKVIEVKILGTYPPEPPQTQ